MQRILITLFVWGFAGLTWADCELSNQEQWQKEVYQDYQRGRKAFLSQVTNCIQKSQSYTKSLNTLVEEHYKKLYSFEEEEKETRFYLLKELFHAMASAGYAPAQYRYGTLYAHTPDTPKYDQHSPDLYTQLYWIKKAAAQGEPLALKSLAAIMIDENNIPLVSPDASVAANIYAHLITEKERLGDDYPFYLANLKRSFKRAKPHDFTPDKKFNLKSLAPKEPYTPQQVFIGRFVNGGTAVRMVLKDSDSQKVEGYYLYDRAYKRWKSTLKITGTLANGKAKLTVFDAKGKAIESFRGSYIQHNNTYSFDLTWKSQSDEQHVVFNSGSLRDSYLTCEEMINFGSIAFNNVGGDLGSGTYASRHVDYYGCAGAINETVALKASISAANNIRREGYGDRCSGSISKMHYRSFLYTMLQLSFDESSLAHFAKFYHGPSGHLLRWADQGYFEKQSYLTLVNELDNVRSSIRAYYQKKGLQAEKLEQAIKSVEGYIFNWADGASTPNTAYLNIDENTTLAELRGFLDKHTADKAKLLSQALLNTANEEIIQYLIDTIDTLNQGEESPLFFAIDSPERMRHLLQNGADVNYQNPFGKTPLYYAIQYGKHESAQLLIDYGANVNHAYKTEKEIENLGYCDYQIKLTQRSPLMHAAQHSDVEMLKLLIDNGANVSQKDEQGNLAIDYAKREKQEANISYLENFIKSESGELTEDMAEGE